jgi:AcrR family transcriptional regulator
LAAASPGSQPTQNIVYHVPAEEPMTRRYVMVRRAEQTEETRRRILRVVLDLVLERGAPSFAIEEICGRADVSLRTVYHHYPSRATLVSAALHELAREMGAAALRAFRADLTKPREALAGYLSETYEVYEQESRRFDAILRLRGDPELEATIARLRAAARAHITHILAAAGDDLRIPLPDAVVVAYLHTPYPVWQTYTADLGMTTPEAIAFVTRFLDRVLFLPVGSDRTC